MGRGRARRRLGALFLGQLVAVGGLGELLMLSSLAHLLPYIVRVTTLALEHGQKGDKETKTMLTTRCRKPFMMMN